MEHGVTIDISKGPLDYCRGLVAVRESCHLLPALRSSAAFYTPMIFANNVDLYFWYISFLPHS